MVSPYKKTSYRNRRHHTNQNSPDTLDQKGFSEIFDEALEGRQPERIQIYTSGYTRDGLPYYNHINKREYSQ